MRTSAALVVCVLLGRTLCAQQPGPRIDSLAFLVGKWIGEGTSEAGAGSGFFTFESSLDDKVLVRRNHAEYPASNGRPPVTHDDVMIVYGDAASRQLRAFYTDSEANTINYVISVSPDGKRVVFLSDPRDAGTRYRLTYVVTRPDRLSLVFESAPAGKPDEFKTFIEGNVRKVP
ncbi:MAG: hypothetical protein ACHQO8_13865 [Vicinamibacterales bacterium]